MFRHHHHHLLGKSTTKTRQEQPPAAGPPGRSSEPTQSLNSQSVCPSLWISPDHNPRWPEPGLHLHNSAPVICFSPGLCIEPLPCQSFLWPAGADGPNATQQSSKKGKSKQRMWASSCTQTCHLCASTSWKSSPVAASERGLSRVKPHKSQIHTYPERKAKQGIQPPIDKSEFHQAKLDKLQRDSRWAVMVRNKTEARQQRSSVNHTQRCLVYANHHLVVFLSSLQTTLSSAYTCTSTACIYSTPCSWILNCNHLLHTWLESTQSCTDKSLKALFMHIWGIYQWDWVRYCWWQLKKTNKQKTKQLLQSNGFRKTFLL